MQTTATAAGMLAIICGALAMRTATPSRPRAALSPGGSGDTVAAFSPEWIRVDPETTWFVPEVAPGQTRVPLAAYVPQSHRWVLIERPWPQVATMIAERSRSERTHPAGVQGDSLSYGWRLDDDFVAKTADNSQSVLVGPDNSRLPVAIRLSSGSRRALYREGGGRRWPTPAFSTLVSRWTARDGLLALALAPETPPKLEEPWLPLMDTSYEPTLSAVVLFDTATRRLRPLVHPALVEREWLGLEFAGDALWIAPTSPADSDQTWADAPARRIGPTLMRYDLRSSTWLTVTPSAIPNFQIRAMRGDGDRLYFIGDAVLATMDARTRRWDVRYLTAHFDTTVDGADTAMATLSARPPHLLAAPAQAGDTSAEIIAAFAEELGPRHLTRFERALERYASFDSLQDIVSMMRAQRGWRWDTGEPFVTESERASALLARPEFVPYLREALAQPSTLSFALTTLARIPGVDVRAELRATIDSAPVPAALMAADTLVRLHDSVAVAWLFQQLAHPERLAGAAPGPGGEWIDMVRRLVILQSR